MASSLAHVMVVAGDRHEWAALDDAGWQSLADELGAVVAAAGCAWLTLRMYEAGAEDALRHITLHRHHLVAAGGQCTVIIDPVGDGRQRFAEAMALVPAAVPIDEFHGRRRRFGGLESASVRRDRPDAAGWDGQDWPS